MCVYGVHFPNSILLRGMVLTSSPLAVAPSCPHGCRLEFLQPDMSCRKPSLVSACWERTCCYEPAQTLADEVMALDENEKKSSPCIPANIPDAEIGAPGLEGRGCAWLLGGPGETLVIRVSEHTWPGCLHALSLSRASRPVPRWQSEPAFLLRADDLLCAMFWAGASCRLWLILLFNVLPPSL